MALSDEHLMIRVQNRDVRAYELLVERHRGAVATAARCTCGPQLADDVAQVAMLALWQNSDSYRPGRGTPRTWLLGIVRNRGIDHLRSQASRRRRTVCMDPNGWIGIADESSAAEPADVQVVRSEEGTAVRRLLATLPDEQRQVVEMAYFWGLSHGQIAERLDVPVGTVKGRLRLALSKLRRGWDGEPAVATAPAIAA